MQAIMSVARQCFIPVRMNSSRVPGEAHIIGNAFTAFASATAPSFEMALSSKVQTLDGVIRLVSC